MRLFGLELRFKLDLPVDLLGLLLPVLEGVPKVRIQPFPPEYVQQVEDGVPPESEAFPVTGWLVGEKNF